MIGRRSATRLAGACLVGAFVIGAGLPGTLPVAAAARFPITRVSRPRPTTTTSTTSPAPAPASTTTTVAPVAPITDPFRPVAPVAAATAHVSIVDFGFSPATITVAAGTTVTWTNTGTAVHSVTSNTGAFDSSPTCPSGPCIDPSNSFSHLFAQAGSYSYHCRVHSNMTGTVIVTAAATTTTTTTTATTGTTVSGVGTVGPTTASPGATGPQLAFTGAPANEAWIALGALLTIALGLALRPRRRPFPVPVPAPRTRPRSSS